MLLTGLQAEGFRSLNQMEVNFDQLTLLIGGNDTGKSSILDLLEVVLDDKRLDPDDFHHPPGKDGPVDTIEVTLEFRLDPERDQEALQYALDDVLKIRKVYTLDGEETYYWIEYPEDERLRLDDFNISLSAEEQKDLIGVFDPSALEELSNKQERAEWLFEYAQNASQTRGWTEAPRRGWGDFLPRFYRYSTMDYDDPGNMILNTLRQVFNSVVYEDEDSQQLVADLKQVRDKAKVAINEKVAELLSYIRKYNDRVQDISYDPTIDFSRGLGAGQFQINDGRGIHYLSKTGDGTKRRMFIATLDWDRDVTLEQAAQDATLPPVIRGYDEPDTNLDYEAQRTMCRAISGIVQEEKARTQAILCTHSPPMINQVPAQHIRLLSLYRGCTQVEQLETGGDSEVEAFLRESARELGITNTLMFYERCFILVEGETEENALPILYRKTYEHSLLEDGIQPINVKGNGAIKEFLRLLSRNRQELTIVFVDSDTQNTDEAELTEETLRSAGFDDDFIDERLLYIGDREFEDAFSNDIIARCLQKKWPKPEGEWVPGDIEPLREQDNKFSDALWEDLVCQCTTASLRSSWSKSVFAKELARCCNKDEIPEAIRLLYKLARTIARSD
jgi:energy-coupling factor transporter ATP-binding protein EcfA2